ncbi:hypothetical protein [Methylobacterium sp. WSM2598]|uniref:hypothetical protein n=1 Tax=Methylobacterium sp. WSM2598 TaxID=398261 RepID=UPI0012F6C3E5|nr:hypothetical protein [Methylobacterium sp. WSM2598]
MLYPQPTLPIHAVTVEAITVATLRAGTRSTEAARIAADASKFGFWQQLGKITHRTVWSRHRCFEERSQKVFCFMQVPVFNELIEMIFIYISVVAEISSGVLAMCICHLEAYMCKIAAYHYFL